MSAKLIAEKALKELRYDFKTFSIQRFISHVSEMKGREIITIPWAMPATVFGAWMSDGEEPKEYIFYRDNVPVIHQVHIQLHELSHFLLGHPTLKINRALIGKVLHGQASLPIVDLLCLRSSKRNDIEIEAEMLADLIQKQVIQNLQLAQLSEDASKRTLADFLKMIGET